MFSGLISSTRDRVLLAVCAAFVCATPALAQQKVTVALIEDGPVYQFAEVRKLFVDELLALTRGEFDVEIVPMSGGWTREGIAAAFDEAYANPDIDMVLVFGFTANQTNASRERYPKPTFLPLVFDADLMGAPVAGRTSGKRNLNFLTEEEHLAEELQTYQRIRPYENAVILIDALILESLPQVRAVTSTIAASAGIGLDYVTHDGADHNLIDKIPAGTDAVIYTGLPRLPPEDFNRFAAGLIERNIAGYSLADRASVERGLLASQTVESDWLRLARRNALNMQAVMLGERASDQPVYFEGKSELTINMATARALGLSPRFDVLSEATILNAEPEAEGPNLDLETVARMAIDSNLDLSAAELDLAIAGRNVSIARSSLLPQIAAGASATERREPADPNFALFPERSIDGSLTLNQNIYSDDVYANLDIQRLNEEATAAGLTAFQRDVIFEATLAYVDALRAETVLKIRQDNLSLTKSNLETAEDRVRVGSTSRADVYRWQSNLASARSDVLRARATVIQAREALNRVLNRPIDAPFQLTPAAADDPFTMSTELFEELVSSPQVFDWVVDWVVNRALDHAPELRQIDALIEAKEREARNRRRDYWLPDFALSTQYADNFSQSGVGSGGIGDGDYDWSISLNASIPLFSGGRRRAELSRTELELKRLRFELSSAEDKLIQAIRAAMHSLQASSTSIELSREAADAARRNLSLVTDAYTQGTLGIIELLDAQNQSLSADLAANNAIYDFVADALTMQRASSSFDFLRTPEEKEFMNRRFEAYIRDRRAETPR